MTFEQWQSLQDEYGFKIIDVHYENMSVEEGKHFLKTLSNNFEDIFNDDEGEDDDI